MAQLLGLLGMHGTIELRAAGSRAWRINNPGNMRNFPFSINHGSIGGAGGFAVFPSESAGMSALQALLSSANYASLTVNATIARFAPPTDGKNTAAYQARVQRMTGIGLSSR